MRRHLYTGMCGAGNFGARGHTSHRLTARSGAHRATGASRRLRAAASSLSAAGIRSGARVALVRKFQFALGVGLAVMSQHKSQIIAMLLVKARLGTHKAGEQWTADPVVSAIVIAGHQQQATAQSTNHNHTNQQSNKTTYQRLMTKSPDKT